MEPGPTATPVPPPHCGDARASVTLVGASPVGKTFHDGERLTLAADYVAPDCTEYATVFYGYFRPGSPWYDYWCVAQHVTCGATLPGVMYTGSRLGGGLALPSPSGRLETVGVPGTVPPRSFGAPPSLEGFYVCGAFLTIYDVTGQAFGVKGSGASTNGGTGLNLGQVAGQPDCSPP